jgi:hypothetical protein
VRIVIVTSISFLLASAVGAISDGPFQLELSFTVPGLPGAIQQVKFNDIDSDGSPEVLATDGHHVVLYSIRTDSLLFNLSLDDTVQLGAILLDDVNRDKIPDIVVTYDGIGASVEVFDGASGLQSRGSISVPRYPSAIGGCDPGPDILYAGDLNGDGNKELLISAEYIELIVPYDWEITRGIAYLYWSFPDSLIWTQNRYFESANACPLQSSPGGVWLRGSTCSYFSHGGYTSKGIDKLSCFLDDTDSIAVPQIPLRTVCYGTPYFQQDDHLFAAYKHDSFPGGQTTFLTIAQTYFRCQDSSYDVGRYSLNLYRMSSPSAISLVWLVDIAGPVYSNFLFPADSSGYILAFRGDSLVMFRESDGSIRSVIPGVPAGQRSWECPFADGIERLVTINDQTVSLYRFDITSDIEEPRQLTPLPFSFALQQPYPNPFNAQLSIPVSFTGAGRIDISVHNLLGQKVAQLFSGKTTGSEMVFPWNAANVGSGVYIVKASSETATRTAKAILLK